jgi:hypothetical protein
VAVSGQTMDPGAGRKALEPQFADTSFKMGWVGGLRVWVWVRVWL